MPTHVIAVSASAAKPSAYEGGVYHFRWRDCRELFEVAPEKYVGPQAGGPQPQPETGRG